MEIDTNYWKTFVHEQLGTAMGNAGCLSIFGRKAARHHRFPEHLTAEYRVRNGHGQWSTRIVSAVPVRSKA